jgi:hypothetical protein
MQLPRGDQRVVTEQTAQHDVEDDVDGPDRRVSQKHLARFAQNVPEQQNIDRDWGGDYRPGRCTHTRHAIPEQANEASDRQRGEDVRLAVDDIETNASRQRGKEDCDVEQDWRGQAIEHFFLF